MLPKSVQATLRDTFIKEDLTVNMKQNLTQLQLASVIHSSWPERKKTDEHILLTFSRIYLRFGTAPSAVQKGSGTWGNVRVSQNRDR